MAKTQQFKRILVPLDGSNLAESVVPFVIGTAEALGSTVVLLHIVEEHAPQKVHGEPHLTSEAEAERYLEGVEQKYEGRVRFEHHVHGTEEHDVAGSIAGHVAELNADIVALCTHGRSGPRRVMYGSIAQQVLRRVAEPVLVVRPGTKLPSQIKTLLVPLDDQHESEEALEVALALARAADATIYLVTIVPTVTTVTGDRSAAARMAPVATIAALDAEEEGSRDYLNRLAEELRAQGISANAVVRRGDPVPSLSEAAAATPADLIVIATHGRSGLNAMMTGSVTATLAGRVSQPLLMVKLKAQ
jgi:nucleotide-binding universal stress UspA family protein